MTAVERMQAAFAHQAQRRIPRGELWVGSGVFGRRGFGADDGLQARIGLCRELGMDFLSLPFEAPSPTQRDYRRFNLREIAEAVASSGLFVCAVVDGPFQGSARRPGDLSVFAARCDEEGPSRLLQMATAVEESVAALLKNGVNAVVIADDIAYQRSTYASPQVMRQRLLPLYSRMVEAIHGGGAYALFHSDGNIVALIPDLVACGFDGLAGCEPECLDLSALKMSYGSQITLMTGIRAELLDCAVPLELRKEEFLNGMRMLARGGGFVMCSACGLGLPEAVERLKTLYAWVDETL